MSASRPEYVRIYADSATDAMWTYYRRFETVDSTRRTFGEWLTIENATAARDCVRQAREYFLSARSAPLLTKPVLLYYGMVSLGKLFFLFNDSPRYDMDTIESFERQGHGLKHHDSTAIDSPYEIEAGHLEVTADKGKSGSQPRGVFPRLAQIVNRSPVNNWYGQRISILEVMRAVPQLDTVLRQVLGEACGYTGLHAETVTHTDGSIELSVSKQEAGVNDVAAIQARVPYLDTSRHAFVVAPHPIRPHSGESFSIRLDVAAEGFGLVVREEFYRGTTTLPPAWHSHRFDSLLTSYMLMYALSIIARYKPHRWSHILEGRDSPLLPVIETHMAICERWWPNLLLNRITGTWVNFAPPNYGR